MELLAAKMNVIMLKRDDILELIGGEKNITMMKKIIIIIICVLLHLYFKHLIQKL